LRRLGTESRDQFRLELFKVSHAVGTGAMERNAKENKKSAPFAELALAAARLG
jgi:hypothetical protein